MNENTTYFHLCIRYECRDINMLGYSTLTRDSSPDFSFNICQNKLMKWIILVLFPLRVNYSQFHLLHGGL